MAETLTGEWINLGEDSDEWECSECGYIVTSEEYPANGIDQLNFCPNCGSYNGVESEARSTIVTDFDDETVGQIARALLAVDDEDTLPLSLLEETLGALEYDDTVDPPTGYIDITPFLVRPPENDEWECTECGCIIPNASRIEPINYCPNCGEYYGED